MWRLLVSCGVDVRIVFFMNRKPATHSSRFESACARAANAVAGVLDILAMTAGGEI
jgi:hypothetical protein